MILKPTLVLSGKQTLHHSLCMAYELHCALDVPVRLDFMMFVTQCDLLTTLVIFPKVGCGIHLQFISKTMASDWICFS